MMRTSVARSKVCDQLDPGTADGPELYRWDRSLAGDVLCESATKPARRSAELNSSLYEEFDAMVCGTKRLPAWKVPCDSQALITREELVVVADLGWGAKDLIRQKRKLVARSGLRPVTPTARA